MSLVAFYFLAFLLLILNNTCSDGKSPYKAARVILAKTEISIRDYYIDTGHLPNSLDQLLSDKETENWMGPYIKENELTDPWGEKYHYQTHNHKSFTISTFAEDKKLGGKKLATDISITSRIDAF